MQIDGFIQEARRLVAYRRMKHRTRHKRRGRNIADRTLFEGWVRLGTGYYGEAWEHTAWPGLVCKISGPAGWGDEEPYACCRPMSDAWPRFAEFCMAHSGEEHLPDVMHLERASYGIHWAAMRRYYPADADSYEVDATQGALNAALQGEYDDDDPHVPSWVPDLAAHMLGVPGLRVDMHSENVMADDSGVWVVTDPFSSTGAY